MAAQSRLQLGMLCTLLIVSLIAPPRVSAGEILGRGLVCLPRGSANYCSWRLLPSDPLDIGFHVYRGASPQDPDPVRLTAVPVAGSTNYEDGPVQAGSTSYYFVRTVDGQGQEGPSSEPARVTAGAASDHLSMQLQTDTIVCRVVPGDLNADGILDFVALTATSGTDCGNIPAGATFVIEAFLSGAGTWTSTWRHDTQINESVNVNNHHAVFPMVWDLDGDASAEVIVRHGADSGQIAVLDGLLGSVRATVPLPHWPLPPGMSDRFSPVVARLRDTTGDGVADPFIVLQCGLYTEPIYFHAFRFETGPDRLVETDTLAYAGTGQNYGFGQHGLAAADIDDDGRDEVLACGLAIEDDFTQKWIVSKPHNDTCFVADLVPSQPGLEVFMGEEGVPFQTRLVLQDGQLYGGGWPRRGRETLGARLGPCGQPPDRCPATQGCYDLGEGEYCYREQHWSWERGWCAQLDADPDFECFEQEKYEDDPDGLPDEVRAHVFSADGLEDEESGRITLWPVDWDFGEGVSETYDFCNPPGISGCSWYSGWPGDILGDSREEVVIFHTGQFRIYTNTALNASRHPTPLGDRGYRGSLARVGVGYNINFMPARSNQARDDLVGGCTPTSCEAQGKDCGTIPDGCGSTLECGACVLPETCGGGGVPNVCGQGTCTPTSCEAQGKDCGTIPDGCGHTLDCGACGPDETCVSNQCVPSGACPPECDGMHCGQHGCVGECGLCGPGLTCTDEGMCVNLDEPDGGCSCGGRGSGGPAIAWLALAALGWLRRGRGRCRAGPR
ncbi:MAG: hypothetical protein JXR96_15450 [Deltaproteobacteria bacterium]|nr:hypothetical protein [Deltaproteobacteria bacterium]